MNVYDYDKRRDRITHISVCMFQSVWDALTQYHGLGSL